MNELKGPVAGSKYQSLFVRGGCRKMLETPLKVNQGQW